MRLQWSQRAARDLRAIGRFIAKDNRAAARRFVETLRLRAGQAASAPWAGRMVPEHGRENIREIIYKNYRIVYLVGDGVVRVLAVFESHRLFPDGTVNPQAE